MAKPKQEDVVYARMIGVRKSNSSGDGFFVIDGRIAFESPISNKKGNAGTASILIPFGRKNIGAILSSNIKGEWYQ